MSIFKCKMCGGTLEINNNETVVTCEYCGTKQTLPRLDDDRRANLYDRANHFRRNNEFDKAMGIYENILNEDKTDAEAYWSLVLCRYGIEYVEDPISHKRIPTVNRAQFTSIFDDADYKSALQYADSYQHSIYEEEAKTINEIQKGILAISQKEEPFDIFICYKESDNSGKRTPDSVLAQELYYQLTQEDFKVFFSRITLEDKLGQEYEPYIFAALNSAKVMVVLGTKPEHFNAVWVKNEWSRYLALIKQGQKKMLIPAYKDMDPYDLPEEFSHLQAQDMSKLGFMQDLIRGIKKITASDEPKTAVVKETVVTGGTSPNIVPLLKRAFMFLEDGEFAKADEFCEQVLNQDPENAQAYLGKLMAELRVKRQEDLKDCKAPFDNNSNYQKALRFADDALKAMLTGCIEHINTRNENARLDKIYTEAYSIMSSARSVNGYYKAAKMFESISGYKDSDELAQRCSVEIVNQTNDEIYQKAATRVKTFIEYRSVESLAEAVELYGQIPGFKDADELKAKYTEELKQVKARQELNVKRTRKMAIIGLAAVSAIVAFAILFSSVIVPNVKYNGAIALMDAGNVVEAYEALVALDGYKDSSDKANSIYDQYKAEKLKVAKAGEYVLFGTYEQDNNTFNGKEGVEWLVLEVKDGKALVISKYALDGKPYNTSYTEVTWETCTLRKWLNNDFLDSAFSDYEKAMISTVTVSADKNPEYSTNPGNATQDQVFLLSITEANKYLNSLSERQCEPTDYAVENGVWERNGGNCRWWLRTPGKYLFYAVDVLTGGVVDENGDYVSCNDIAVRPAMWIDFTSVK